MVQYVQKGEKNRLSSNNGKKEGEGGLLCRKLRDAAWFHGIFLICEEIGDQGSVVWRARS